MILYYEKLPTVIQNIVKNKIVSAQLIRPHNNRLPYSYLILGSGFDIETTTVVQPYFIGAYCYHWQISFDDVTVGGRSLQSAETFFRYLLTIIPDKTRLLVFDANLGFEFAFLKYYWKRIGITEFFSKSKRNPLKVVLQNKIEFREVLGLFGRNLESIANSFSSVKKLKGDLDYTKYRFSNTPLTAKEQQYCENDVQILSQLSNYVFSHYFGENIDLPVTAISEIRMMIKQAMGKRRNLIMQDLQDQMPDETTYYIFRNYLFKGGLCGTNSLYMNRTLHNVGSADITSHYPSVMNHFLFPSGYVNETDPSDFMRFNNKPYIAIIEFFELKSKTSHSILSTHKAVDFDYSYETVSQHAQKDFRQHNSKYIVDNGRIFYAESITYVVNDVEFRSILQSYNFKSYKIYRCWEIEKYARLPYYVLQVLNDEYLKKEDLKARKLDDTVEYQFSKNRVNGTFGMMCTALYSDEFIIDEYGEISPKKVDGETYKREYKQSIKSIFLNPLWGMWITSYARSILVDAIVRFPHCIIQYDTDSLYYNKNHSESTKLEAYLKFRDAQTIKLNDILFHGNAHFRSLGTWDFWDKPATHFKALGSKRYMYRKWDKKKQKFIIKSVVAGCVKGTILDQFLSDKQYSEIVSTQQINELFDFFHDGMIIDEKHSKKLTTHYIDTQGKFENRTVYFRSSQTRPDQFSSEQTSSNQHETVCFGSGIALVPTSFKMGLSDAHTRFYLTMQNLYNNAPKGISKIYEDILSDVEITEIFDE